MLDSVKKLKTDPKLLRLLEEAKTAYEKMSPEEKEKMHKAQAESWSRQDMD